MENTFCAGRWRVRPFLGHIMEQSWVGKAWLTKDIVVQIQDRWECLLCPNSHVRRARIHMWEFDSVINDQDSYGIYQPFLIYHADTNWLMSLLSQLSRRRMYFHTALLQLRASADMFVLVCLFYYDSVTPLKGGANAMAFSLWRGPLQKAY